MYYLSGYFEWSVMRSRLPGGRPVAAYFTHREEQPPGNKKAALYDRLAQQMDLRIATCARYGNDLAGYGPTAQITPPVERGRFTISARNGRTGPFVAGFSGYTYGNGRKGEALAAQLVARNWPDVQWRASGRGWPVPTASYAWRDLPLFYQSLDVLVITALVEGVPMPPLEALACGVSVVIPQGVGLLDELPTLRGIHRYRRGDAADLAKAFGEALLDRPAVDREWLRAVTEPYSITAWCEQHRAVFQELFA